MISIIRENRLHYPSGGHFYSPDEAFPEYRHEHVSPRANPVYRTVRQCLAQAGLDAAHFGSADWNPLKGLFRREAVCSFCATSFTTGRVNESESAFLRKVHARFGAPSGCRLRAPRSRSEGGGELRQRPGPVV